MTEFFKGKAVVLTGAASGIGAALAQQLAARGARLLLADVDATRLEALAAGLKVSSGTVLTQSCDVADEAQLQTLAGRSVSELGGADILINNAGVALVAPVSSLALADAQWLMGINFWGVVNGCRLFLPQLTRRPGSVIVNISSIFAMLSVPTQSIYNASKAAVRAFSDALREEVREQGVQVLCVHPGGIRTRIVEQARMRDISLVADTPEAMRQRFLDNAPTSAEQAASAILDAIERGQTRLLIGRDAKWGDFIYRLAPRRASAWLTALGRKRRAASKNA